MPDPCADAVEAYRAALQALLDLLGVLDQARRALSVAQSTLMLVERALAAGQGDANMLAMEAQAKAQLAAAQNAFDAASKPIAAARAAVAAARMRMRAACEDLPTIDINIGAARLTIPAGLVFTRQLERHLGVLRRLPEDEVGRIKHIDVQAHDGSKSSFIDHLTGNTRDGIVLGQNIDGDITVFYGPTLSHPHPTHLGDVLKHEIAHSIFNALPDAARDAWRDFWSHNLRIMPTDYARSNAADGFCEAYAFYRDGKRLDRNVTAALRRALGL